MIISSIAEEILSYIQKNDPSFPKDEYSLALTKYGIEITISSALNIIIILLLSLLMNCFFEAIVFLLVFISTRKFTGGFHATSYFKCNITFGFCFIFSMGIYQLTRELYAIELCTVQIICNIVFAFFVCPIINPNKPIKSNRHYIKCKIISASLFALWGAIGLLLLYCQNPVGAVILITMQLVVLLCILSKHFERRGKNGHS